jgi:hypothetical protein
MRRILCFAVSAIFLAASSAAFGADFWETKKYDKWSQKECTKLLESSPWAQDLTQISSTIQQSTSASDDGKQFYYKYQVQLRSALPIRQALVRQMQLAQKYDTLQPEQQKQFDESAKAFLASDVSDKVIVYVTYEINSQNKAMEMARYWQAQTTDLIRNNVFLRSSSGDKIYLSQYVPPQGADRSFQFIFSRKINDKLLLSPEDKSLVLEFSYPPITPPGGNSALGDGRGFMEFKPKKMIFEGNLTY